MSRKSHWEQIWSAVPRTTDINSSREDFSVGPAADFVANKLWSTATSLSCLSVAVHGAAAAAAPDQGGEARLDLSEGSARRHDARVTGLAMGSAVEPSAGHWPESPRTARQMSA
jgi:hypothetical protein